MLHNRAIHYFLVYFANTEYFSPCSTIYGPFGDTYCDISCVYVPMTDVTTTFKKLPALNISYLTLLIRSEGNSIPADLLGQMRFNRPTDKINISLDIRGDYLKEEKPLLTVDPNAFRQQNSSLVNFYMTSLDTSRMDFQFLSDVGADLRQITFDS